jgi:hypothetical protein
MGHKHCRNEHRDYDGLCAVDDDVAGRASDRGEERENALKGKLQSSTRTVRAMSFERTETRRSRRSA